MNMASRYKFSEKEIEGIEQARKENKDKRAERRLKALEMRAKGAISKEVSVATGFHAAYVTQLVAKYRDHGLDAISGNHYGGNHRNMSVEEETAILAPFKERAEKGELVEVSEIAKAYQAAVDHPVSNGQIYFVLHRHGCGERSAQPIPLRPLRLGVPHPELHSYHAGTGGRGALAAAVPTRSRGGWPRGALVLERHDV